MLAPRDRAGGCGEALLDDGGRYAVGRLGCCFVARPQQHRGLELAHGDTRAGRAQEVEGTTTTEKVDSFHGFKAQLVVDQDTHPGTFPTLETVTACGGEVGEHAARPSVQDRQPLPLSERQLARER